MKSLPRASRLSGLVLALAVAGCEGGAGANSASATHPLIGNPAPDFDLAAQSGGKRAKLDGAKGKIGIVDFWATWCGPCRVSFPKYEAIAKKFAGSVVVLGVSEDDDADGIADFAKQTGVTFPLAWDTDKSVAANYHPSSMPTSFILDKNGLVRFVHEGFRDGDEQEIEAQIKSLAQ